MQTAAITTERKNFAMKQKNMPKETVAETTESNSSLPLAHPKWELFAQAVASGKTAKEAYKQTFNCADSTARRRSTVIATNSLVRARIAYLQAENAKVAALGREETLQILANIARDNKQDTRARIQAIQENNRMNGWNETNFNVKSEGIVFNLGNVLKTDTDSNGD